MEVGLGAIAAVLQGPNSLCLLLLLSLVSLYGSNLQASVQRHLYEPVTGGDDIVTIRPRREIKLLRYLQGYEL